MRWFLLGALVLLLLAGLASAKKSHYEVLGVPRNANDKAIKKAYRTLARKYHPDRHQDPTKKQKAEKLFIRVAQAYDTLSDPEKRRIYDQVGDEGVNQHEQQQAQGGAGGHGGPGGPGGPGGFQFQGGFDPFKLFAQMFGNDFGAQFGGQGGQGGRGGGRRRPQEPQPQREDFSRSVTMITQNNAKDFLGKEVRKKDGRPWMVMFYAPWCGHCKAAKPEFERFAERANGVVRAGAVNCDQQAGNAQLCAYYGVQGFPTFQFILGSKRETYNGQRNAGGFNNFAQRLLPASKVKLVRDAAEAAAHCRKSGKRCVVLHTKHREPTPLFRALALRDDAVATFCMVGGAKASKLLVDGQTFTGSKFDMESLHKFVVKGCGKGQCAADA